MIEVFRTDVSTAEKAAILIFIFSLTLPELKINFDLEDCDRILRIDANEIIPEEIISICNRYGCFCEVLPE